MDTGCAKEQTIRELVLDCHIAEAKIQGQLENEFDRQPRKEGVEETPSFFNVLDEIVVSLKQLHKSQNDTIDFIVSKIKPKL